MIRGLQPGLPLYNCDDRIITFASSQISRSESTVYAPVTAQIEKGKGDITLHVSVTANIGKKRSDGKLGRFGCLPANAIASKRKGMYEGMLKRAMA